MGSVAVDSGGNVYAGTGGNSVYKLDASGKQVWNFSTDSIVQSVAVDSGGNVYAGTDAQSVYKLDASGKQVWNFTADSCVFSVAVDSSSNVYAGTDAQSVYKLTPDGSNTTPITVGESLYNGIPSNGIALYGSVTGYSSSNPLGIQGGSINLKAPLSSCPNGIKIHFSNISYSITGEAMDNQCSIPDIRIPKGSSSGSTTASSVSSAFGTISITASINGLALSFAVYQSDPYGEQRSNTGTGIASYINSPITKMLAITSITAY